MHKNEKRYLQQAESSAIRFPRDGRSHLKDGNESMYTLKLPNLYPEYQLAVSLISGQHTICFHNSRILANAVPLGFCCGGFSSTAGYDPATKLNLRRATFAPLRRVLSKGCHSFLFEWLEKVSQPSLAEPFGSDSGVIESTAACLFPRSGVTTRLPSLCRSRKPRPS